jgi:hypothetical protein
MKNIIIILVITIMATSVTAFSPEKRPTSLTPPIIKIK